jgi:hypothetical protein
MAWQYHEFIRIACVGATRGAALEALRGRIEKLRAQGWMLPSDSLVAVRDSMGLATAELKLPARSQRGAGYVIRRYIEDRKPRRTTSGTQPKFSFDDDVEENAG